ncbi:MAG: flavin-containing monooxygenase, partial [Caulobacteraceae bacterium]
EARGRWIVSTSRGDGMAARFVVMANGPLHRPKLPGIEGIETFEGHAFHTSRWDYAYTGGDSSGGLVGLKDKRVAIIGTGASAVQCVPHLAEGAKHLFVFQRTPSSIDVRANRPTDPEWAAGLAPGWQQRRMDNFNTLVSGGFQEEDLVGDGWTDIIGNLILLARKEAGSGKSPEELAQMMQLADFQKMEQVRARVDAIVADRRTAEALKPWYNQFCKRPCFHDEYLAAFNLPNVTLVDTAGRGVTRITKNAVIANDESFEIDCLIWATGFEVGTSYARRSGYEVFGKEGRSLTQKWKEGVATLHGLMSREFPNLFIISHSQSGFTVNFPHMINEQSRHIAHVIAAARQRQAHRIEPSGMAEEAWVETIVSSAIQRQKFQEECTPGYYNNEGQPSALAARNGPYGKGPVAFAALLAEWRAKGDLEGLELS